MDTNIYTWIGEATAYDKKQMLEVRHPKVGLKVYLLLQMAKAEF